MLPLKKKQLSLVKKSSKLKPCGWCSVKEKGTEEIKHKRATLCLKAFISILYHRSLRVHAGHEGKAMTWFQMWVLKFRSQEEGVDGMLQLKSSFGNVTTVVMSLQWLGEDGSPLTFRSGSLGSAQHWKTALGIFSTPSNTPLSLKRVSHAKIYLASQLSSM